MRQLLFEYAALLILTPGVIWEVCRSFASARPLWFFATPYLLGAVNIAGETLQYCNIGPEWMQDHMHNAGVGFYSIILLAIVPLFQSTIDKNAMAVGAPNIVNYLFFSWTVVAIGGMIGEVLAVTVDKAEAIAQGYSGELDYLDLLACVIGIALIALNHFYVRPRAMRGVTVTN